MPKNSPTGLIASFMFYLGATAFIAAAYLGFDVAKFVLRSQVKIENGIEIRYVPSDPIANRPNTFWGVWQIPLIFMFIASPLLGFGLWGMSLARDRDKHAHRLIEMGHQIMADFVRLEPGKMMVDNQRSHIIVSEWHNPTNNHKYTFKSQDTWVELNKLHKNHLVAVYINPRNPRDYYVSLPN